MCLKAFERYVASNVLIPQREQIMVKEDLKALPYAGEQLIFVALLILLLMISVWMVFLCLSPDLPSGRLYSAATWAGTASGLSVTAALVKQIPKNLWIRYTMNSRMA
jgi:hypothetical protein